MISKKQADGQNGWVLYRDNSVDNLRFRVYDGTQKNIDTPNGSIVEDKWQHVAVTYDESNTTIRIYVDGTNKETSTLLNIGNATNSESLTIGFADTWNAYLNGNIDDVRFYDRALSADEIKALAQAEVHWDNDNTYTLQDALDADEDVNLYSGTLVTGGQDINVGGSWANYNDATCTGTTSSVTFDAIDTGHTIKTNNQTFHNIVFDDGGVDGGGWSLTTDALETGNLFTVTASDSADGVDLDGYDLNVAGDFIIAAAGEVTASNSSITLSGDWNSRAGTFNENLGSVVFAGTGKGILTAAGTWDDGIFNDMFFTGSYTLMNSADFIGSDASSGQLIIAANSTFNIDTGYIGDIQYQRVLTIGSGATLGGSGRFTYETNQSTLPSITNNGTISVGTFEYSLAQNTTPTIPALTYGGNLEIDNQDAGPYIAYIQAGTLNVSGNFTIDGADASNIGTVDNSANDTPINVGGNFTVNPDGAFIPGLSTVTFNGSSADQTVTMNSQTFYNVVINNINADTANDDIVLADAWNVDNNLTVTDGDLQGGSYDLNIAGTWSMATAGTFTAGTSSVFFDDSGKVTTLSGNTAFYNLAIITPSKQVDFTAGTTTTVSNAFTINGQAVGTYIDLSSTVAGTQWTINTPATTEFVAFADIQDSVSALDSLTALNSVDRGNNIFWVFGLYQATGFNDAADGAWTANTTWGTAAGSVMGVNYPGPSDHVTVDSHTVTMSADAYAGGIVVNNDNETTDTEVTDGGYDFSVYGNIDIEDQQDLITSTGKWMQINDGTVANPHSSNALDVFEVAANISSSTSGNTYVDAVTLNSGSILTVNNFLYVLSDENDFLDVDADAVLTGGSIVEIMPQATPLDQKSFDADVDIRITADTSTLNMTGDWTLTQGLAVFAESTGEAEADSMVLDTNDNNLSVAGDLTLGFNSGAAPNGYAGKILFKSGTHTISGNLVKAHPARSWGWFDLGTADIHVGGDVDFRYGTVTPGASAVTMNASSGTSTIYSWSQTFNNLVFDDGGGTAIFRIADNMDVNGVFTLTDGSIDMSTNNADLKVAGNFHLVSGTYTKGDGTVNFDGDLTFTDSIGGVDIGNLVIGGSPETTDLATDLTASTLTINYSDTLNTHGYDLDIGGVIDVNGTLNATDDGEGDRTVIAAGASWDMTGGTFTIDNSSVTFDSAATGNTIISEGSSFYDLLFNDGGGDSGGWSLADALITSNSMTVTATDSVNGVNLAGYDLAVAGDFTIALSGEASASNSTVHVAGDWANSGEFTPGSSTVTFDGTAAQAIAMGSSAFNDLTVTNASADVTFSEAFTAADFTAATASTSLRFQQGLTFTISDTLTLTGTSGSEVFLNSVDGSSQFTLDVTGGEQSVSYVNVANSAASTNDIVAAASINSLGNDNTDPVPHWVFLSTALATGGSNDGFDHIFTANSDLVDFYSAADQVLIYGDAATAISMIVVKQEYGMAGAGINLTDDIRIKIPASFDMTWDSADVNAIITGSGSLKVSGVVSYEDSDKTLVVQVTSNFSDDDSISISGLAFDNFNTVEYDNLEIEIDNADNTLETDIFLKTINLPVSTAAHTGGADDGFDHILYRQSDADAIWFGINF